MLNTLRYLWSLYDYYTKFKQSSDFFMHDELLTITRLRNMNGLIVDIRGEIGCSSISISSKYVTLNTPQATLDLFFNKSWMEVKAQYPRRYWYYQMEKRMINYQCSKNKKLK